MVGDAAQAAPHRALDVQTLGCDFLAVSGHKMCGPSGAGALWGRAELLERMEPFLLGGHMIRAVGDEETTWGALPHKFEAGTAPMAEAVGFGAAIDYLNGDRLRRDRAARAPARRLRARRSRRAALGDAPTGRRRSAAPGSSRFNVDEIHPHDVAQILDMDAVAIRAGHHCCQPLMRKLGVVATNRASFYLYTTTEEIDRLVAGLHRARQVFA